MRKMFIRKRAKRKSKLKATNSQERKWGKDGKMKQRRHQEMRNFKRFRETRQMGGRMRSYDIPAVKYLLSKPYIDARIARSECPVACLHHVQSRHLTVQRHWLLHRCKVRWPSESFQRQALSLNF